MKMMKGLIMCIQFFTSIPIPYEVPMDRRHINMAIKMFPVLGLLQGVSIWNTCVCIDWVDAIISACDCFYHLVIAK